MLLNVPSNSALVLVLAALVLVGIVLVVTYLFYPRLRHTLGRSNLEIGAGLVVLGITIGLAFLWLPLHGTSDERIFLHWMNQLSQQGILSTYANDHSGTLSAIDLQSRDYPPLTYVLLYGAAQLGQLLNLTPLFGLKLLLAGFVVASCLVFWVWTGNPIALGIFAVLLLVDGMIYGYLDPFFTPTLLLALWALQKNKYAWGVVLLGLSCLIKWQPLIIAPFVIAFVIWNDAPSDVWHVIHWRRLLTAVVVPLALELAGLALVFGLAPIVSIQAATANPQLSGQALNANWILTHALHVFDPQQFGTLRHLSAEVIRTLDWHIVLGPKLLFVLFYAASGIVFLLGPKTFERLVLFALLGFLAYFTFNTGVHENHLYVAALLGIVAWDLAPARNWLALVWTAVCIVNIRLFYNWDGTKLTVARVIRGIDPALPLSILVTLFFLYYFARVIQHDGVLASRVAEWKRWNAVRRSKVSPAT